MITFLAVVHILVAFLLIFLVLIQDSKGGAMGGLMGGGNSSSLLGATGATTFMVKVTRIVAVIFAGTCIALTMISSNSSKSVIDGYIPPAGTETAPAAVPGQEATQSPENSKKDDTPTN